MNIIKTIKLFDFGTGTPTPGERISRQLPHGSNFFDIKIDDAGIVYTFVAMEDSRQEVTRYFTTYPENVEVDITRVSGYLGTVTYGGMWWHIFDSNAPITEEARTSVDPLLMGGAPADEIPAQSTNEN